MLVIIGILSFLLSREKKRHQATKEATSAIDNYGYPLVAKYELDPGDWAHQSPSVMQHPAESDVSGSDARRIEADSRELPSLRPELPGSWS